MQDDRRSELPAFIVIRVCNLILFDSGKATVLEPFKPVAARLTATLEKEPGKIRVVGHTDNTPISNTRFPSNYELSLERAKAVAAVIKLGLSDPGRVEVEGKGADAPIDTNSTPRGTREQPACRNIRLLEANSDGFEKAAGDAWQGHYSYCSYTGSVSDRSRR